MAVPTTVNTETYYEEVDRYDRLLALYHTGIESKRKLLAYYLKYKRKQLLELLTSRNSNYLQFTDVNRALKQFGNVTLNDLALRTIDTVLKFKCFDLFWDCCLLNTSLEDILNIHKDMLYSTYVNSESQHGTQSLTKDQWNTIFESGENMEINEDGSGQCLSASKGITLPRLDKELNLLLLSIICPLFKSVNVVTECQSQISQIAVLQWKIKYHEFSDIWDKLEAEIITISSHYQLSDQFMLECSRVKVATFDRAQRQLNRKSILEEAFSYPDFIKNTDSLNRLRDELYTINLEDNLNCARIYCGKEIHVPLINGACKEGAYLESVIGEAENYWKFRKSVSSNQVVDPCQEEHKELKGKRKQDEIQEKMKCHNHLKLVQLIVVFARNALVDVLKHRLPGSNYGDFFDGMKDRLFSKLDKRERKLLYPDNSEYTGELEDLDISLIYVILRNLKTINPHVRGWGNNPNGDDRSLSANIDRIRIYKNYLVSHCAKYCLNEEDFVTTWKKISQCIIEIGGQEYKRLIGVSFTSTIDPVLEMELCDAYEQFKESHRLEDIKLTKMKEDLDEIRRYLKLDNSEQFDNAPSQKDSSANHCYNCKQMADGKSMATKVTSAQNTSNCATFSGSISTTEVSQHSNVESACSETSEIAAQATGSVFSGGNNSQSGSIRLELRIDGDHIPEEIRQLFQNSDEVCLLYVRKGSIIIGLDISSSAFHNVGHFLEIIDALVASILQNENGDKSHVTVSVDFFDKNNEYLTFFKPIGDKYEKVVVAVQEYGTCSQIELIKYQMKRQNLTFWKLLHENSHELYHLCYQTRCCQCGPIDKLPNIRTLHKGQYFKLFEQDAKLRLIGHDQTRKISECCYYPSALAREDDLDLLLANTILFHCCQELLWDCCLRAKGKTLQDFLNENKHAIYHMLISDKPCRSCRNDIKPEVKGKIEDHEWCLLFSKLISGDDPSVHFANQTVTTNDLNTNLSYTLLQEFSEEVKISKQLLEYRNTIANHASSTINSIDFEQMWSEIQRILLHLSQIYGGDEVVREKLLLLESKRLQHAHIDSLITDMKTEVESDSKLNDIWIVVKDHFCNKGELEEHLNSLPCDIFKQRKVVYERRSSSGLQSNLLQMNGQLKGTEFHLDKFSVKFQHDDTKNATAAKRNIIKRFIRHITRFMFTKTHSTERQKESIAIRVRLNDPLSCTVQQTNIPDDEEIIYISDPGQDFEEVIHPGDSFMCGQCKTAATSVKTFKEHKKTHKILPRKDILVTLSIQGLPYDQIEEIIEMCIPKGIQIQNIQILDQVMGNLIIWTRMSIAVFKTKDVFLTSIEHVYKELFRKSPAEIDRTLDVSIDVTIADESEDDFENDQNDVFRCGVCLKEFCVLAAFIKHKTSPLCRKQIGVLPFVTTVPDRYQVVEYNTDAFPRLKYLHQDMDLCVKTEEMKAMILKDVEKYPHAIIYNESSDVDSFYLRNHRKIERMVSHGDINTACKNGIPTVILCVLRADYGHLTSVDIKCLQKIRKELPDQWIDNTLFVVTATSFSGRFRNFHTLSNEICKELEVNINNISFRIFKSQDVDIFDRMSLYLVKQVVRNQTIVYRNIQSLECKVKEAIEQTESYAFTTTLRGVLLSGPLGGNLLNILRQGARSYTWNGSSITYNKFTVTEATNQIAKYACEFLGKEIVQTIIRHLKDHLQSGNHDVFSVLFQHIDLKDFEAKILENIVLVLISLILGPLGWIVSAIVIFFSGTNINSDSFRNEVAGKMQTQINDNKEKIILEVVEKFRSDTIPRYRNLQMSVSYTDLDLHKFFREKEDLIKKHNIENEFQSIARKNNLIRDFKFEDNTLKVFVRGDYKNYADVNGFVYTYFRNDIYTQVYMDQ